MKPAAPGPSTPAYKISQPDLKSPIRPHLRGDFITLRADQTVGEALESLRTEELPEKIIYFYVLDASGRLVGVVPTRRLLMSPPDRVVSAIMVEKVITLPDTATVEVACEHFLRHKFLAFPVVNPEGRMVGVVDIGLFSDELFDIVERRSAESLFQLIGLHIALGRKTTPWGSFKDRFPWLLCNIGGGLLCALLASLYEEFLDSAIVLALFIPVVLALAESVSMQSMAMTLQTLHGEGGGVRTMVRALFRELLAATLLGLGSGGLVLLFAYWWKGDLMMSAAIGASICLSMITACLLGVALPAGVRAFRGDPRVAAGPIVLAFADVATLLFYFNLAGLLLSRR